MFSRFIHFIVYIQIHCMYILHFVLSVLLISSRRVLLIPWDFSIYSHVIYKWRYFISSIYILFVYFSCLLLGRTVGVRVKKRWERISLPCYWFLEESIQFLTIKYDASCSYLVDILYHVEEVPLFLDCWEFLPGSSQKLLLHQFIWLCFFFFFSSYTEFYWLTLWCWVSLTNL